MAIRSWQHDDRDMPYRQLMQEYDLPQNFTPPMTRLLYTANMPDPVRYQLPDGLWLIIHFHQLQETPGSLVDRLFVRSITISDEARSPFPEHVDPGGYPFDFSIPTLPYSRREPMALTAP